MNLLAKVSRRLRRFVRSVEYAYAEPPADAPVGSADWLIAAEMKFGGHISNVERRAVSAADPRDETALRRGGMTGGDRMFHHGYAGIYAEHLAPFLARRYDRLTVVEAGILRGTGLAIWGELFPNADIIGLDIDLSHTRENLPGLKARGAFAKGEPELYVFDQFIDGEAKMKDILGARRIDIFIDDGFHSIETIMNTFRAALPLLADRFVYFVEDNDDVAPLLADAFPDKKVTESDEMTVIEPGKPNRRSCAPSARTPSAP
jgi:hypothetical protein